MKTCRYCGGPTRGRETDIRCSSPDCKRAFQRERCREQQRQARSEYAARGESYRNRWARRAIDGAQYIGRKSNTECVDCGVPVAHGRTEETRCRKCGKRRNNERRTAEARRTARRRRAEKRLAQAAEGVSRGWVFVSGPCHSCGVEFTCQQMNDPAKFCSRTCSRRENKAIRRARQKAVRISPGRRHAVFVRDGWMCRICGDPVNRGAQVPELDAPVVDHRIPLARGGAHAPENWQTAHFYCNSVKCDQLDYDFAEEASA